MGRTIPRRQRRLLSEFSQSSMKVTTNQSATSLMLREEDSIANCEVDVPPEKKLCAADVSFYFN